MILIFIGSGLCVNGITQSFPLNKIHFLAYTFIYIYSFFYMMEGMSQVLWNDFLSHASAAVIEGSCCAWCSTFSDVHIGQQSLFYRHDHLQQPEKLAMDLWLWTYLSTGYFPAIYISLLSMSGKCCTASAFHMFCIWAFHVLQNTCVRLSLK